MRAVIIILIIKGPYLNSTKGRALIYPFSTINIGAISEENIISAFIRNKMTHETHELYERTAVSCSWTFRNNRIKGVNNVNTNNLLSLSFFRLSRAFVSAVKI